MMLDDPELLDQIEFSLNDNLFNVESAILSFETEWSTSSPRRPTRSFMSAYRMFMMWLGAYLVSP